jgi:hypothetical protein
MRFLLIHEFDNQAGYEAQSHDLPKEQDFPWTPSEKGGSLREFVL